MVYIPKINHKIICTSFITSPALRIMPSYKALQNCCLFSLSQFLWNHHVLPEHDSQNGWTDLAEIFRTGETVGLDPYRFFKNMSLHKFKCIWYITISWKMVGLTDNHRVWLGLTGDFKFNFRNSTLEIFSLKNQSKNYDDFILKN